MRRSAARRTRAFTLVEAMMAAAVLAVFAACAAATLRRARADAARTACRANLRRLGDGLAHYLDRHDGYLPMVENLPATTGLGVAPGFARLADALAEDVPDPAAFRCPADRVGYFERDGTSYWWNAARLNGLYYGGRAHPRRRRDVMRHPRTGEWREAAPRVLWDVEPFHGRLTVAMRSESNGDLVKEPADGARNVLTLDALPRPAGRGPDGPPSPPASRRLPKNRP